MGYQILEDGRVEIRELARGQGEYEVSYLAQAVRAGTESHQPVIQKGTTRQSLAPASRAQAIQSETAARRPEKKQIETLRKPEGVGPGVGEKQ